MEHTPNKEGIVRSEGDIPDLVSHYKLDTMLAELSPGGTLPEVKYKVRLVNEKDLRRSDKDPRVFARYGADFNSSVGHTSFKDLMGIATDDADVIIRIDEALANSDEALIGILAHELWEIRNLQAMISFSPNKRIKITSFSDLVGPTGTLHMQAWTIHDKVITRMRENQ